MGSERPQRVAGLAWAGRAEPESRSVACSAGPVLGTPLCSHGGSESFTISFLCFVSRAQQGQVHGPGTGGSGLLMVPPSATSPPSLP